MGETFVTDNLTPDVKGVSLALGFFDGIHCAHAKVLNDALEFSRKFGTKSCVITFKNHPSEILHSKKQEFITTPAERLEIFKNLGFDIVIMADFTDKTANMSAEEYLQRVIINLAPKTISVGYNHKFGAKKSGDVMFLSQNAPKYDYILSVVPPVKTSNTPVSSTYIKSLIKSGKIEEANALLIKPFSLSNIVVHGMERGRMLGFPTANINFPDNKIIPRYGVYSGYTNINGKKYPAIANVGLRPTYSDIKIPLTEVYILSFDKNIYNEKIEFEFLKKLRDEVAFPSVDALKEQIQNDISDVVAFFNK